MIKIAKKTDEESKSTVPPLFPISIIVFVLSSHWDSDDRVRPGPSYDQGPRIMVQNQMAAAASCFGHRSYLDRPEDIKALNGTRKFMSGPGGSRHDSSIKTARTKEGSCILLLSICASRELLGSEG